MKKNKRIALKAAAWVIIIAACLLFARIFVFNLHTKSDISGNTAFAPKVLTKEVKVEDKPIDGYVISYGFGLRSLAIELKDKIATVSEAKLKVKPVKQKDGYIRLSIDKNNRGITITDGNIEIKGRNYSDCEKLMNVFANTYLGFAFSGEEREHILDNAEYINIPANVFANKEGAWIEEREPIICLWKTDEARGIYSDGNVSLKSELLSYSDDMLYDYVKLMKYCGYTGIQVTDMCSAWSQYGGYEFVHDRLRFMADAAHSLDMKFTLWVWGAEFEGYGWVDDSVVYYDYEKSPYAFDCPEAVDTFDKYYSIYAELADCSDRVIMHFNDPGKLDTCTDIGYFANMFKEKCMAVNPDIDFGINCYTYQISFEEMAGNLDCEYTVYSGVVRTDDDRNNVEQFRHYALNEGKKLGVWSWNLTEMEIDQLAEMNVNTDIIAKSYLATKEYDDVMKPTYWSEMDSYHIANFFSLYASGHLLQDPNIDSQTLLHESAEAIVGSEYADDLTEVLSLISDARSGESFEEFKNEYDEYILLSDDYPAKDLYDRADAAVTRLEEMIAADLKNNTAPIPMSSSEMLSLILPHVVQIKEYSEFRINLQKAEEMISEGTSTKKVEEFVNSMYVPVHDYNTVIGSWGQTEARAQYQLLDEFCKANGIDTPHDSVFDYYRKERILWGMIEKQKKETERVSFDISTNYQLGAAFGTEETERLTLELEKEGLVTKCSDNEVYLTDWQNYKYDF